MTLDSKDTMTSVEAGKHEASLHSSTSFHTSKLDQTAAQKGRY